MCTIHNVTLKPLSNHGWLRQNLKVILGNRKCHFLNEGSQKITSTLYTASWVPLMQN